MGIEVNKNAFENAKYLIEKGRFVNDSKHWDSENPDTQVQDQFIHEHGIKAYGEWHLGIKASGDYDIKSTYSFPYGDFKDVHKDALVAIEERAAQYNHLAVRDAAKELLSLLEAAAEGK